MELPIQIVVWGDLGVAQFLTGLLPWAAAAARHTALRLLLVPQVVVDQFLEQQVIEPVHLEHKDMQEVMLVQAPSTLPAVVVGVLVVQEDRVLQAAQPQILYQRPQVELEALGF